VQTTIASSSCAIMHFSTGNNEGFTPIGPFENKTTLSEDDKNLQAIPQKEIIEQIHLELGEINNNNQKFSAEKLSNELLFSPHKDTISITDGKKGKKINTKWYID
jgi:hypothetical protein